MIICTLFFFIKNQRFSTIQTAKNRCFSTITTVKNQRFLTIPTEKKQRFLTILKIWLKINVLGCRLLSKTFTYMAIVHNPLKNHWIFFGQIDGSTVDMSTFESLTSLRFNSIIVTWKTI